MRSLHAPHTVAAVLAAALCGLAAPAPAQEGQALAGTFVALQEAAGERFLVLRGGARLGIPAEAWTRLQGVLEGLESGDAVSYTLDANKRLATLERRAQAEAARRQNVAGRFERYQNLAGRHWLELDGDRRFQISEEEYTKLSRVILFLKKGDPVRVGVERGWVLEVLRGAPPKDLDPEVEAAILASEPGDVVLVNGQPARFLSANLTEVRIQPQVPGTDPPKFVEGGTQSIPLERVVGFVNPRLQVKQADAVREKDPFDEAGVRPGDMIGVGIRQGQLLDLTDETYTLREWRNDEWADVVTERRQGAPPIRAVSLTSQVVVPLPEGELTLRVARARSAREGGLKIEARLTHTADAHLVVGGRLKVTLFALSREPSPAPLATEEAALPTLFPGVEVAIEHRPQAEGAVDARVELELAPEQFVAVASPQAKGPLVQVIEAATASNSLDLLARAYKAAAGNGDLELARLLLCRALAVPGPPASREEHRELLRRSLALFGEPIGPLVLGEVDAVDRDLTITTIERGQLKRAPLPGTTRPLEWKRRMIELLGHVPGALEGEVGRRLFDLARTRDDFLEPLLTAFTSRPDEAVSVLLGLATGTTDSSSDDERERAERAARVLARLGAPMLDPLFTELRRRDVDTSELERMRAAVGASRANEVVMRSLEVLIEVALARERAKLDAQVEAARERSAGRDWAGAITLLEQVLARSPQHPEARELLPKALVARGEELASGDRGAAGELFRRALEYPDPAVQARAKPAYGQLLLDAVREEVEVVVIRDRPAHFGALVRPAAFGESFGGQETDGDYVRVQLGADAWGYVRRKCLTQSGPEAWTISDPAPTFDTIERALEAVLEVAPSLELQVAQTRGQLCAREAKARYDVEDYQAALALFERARELAPTDERLQLYWSCMLRARKNTILMVAVLLVFVVLIWAARAFAKPKTVQHVGEYKYYGAERSRRERDLDVDGAPVEPVEGEPQP